MMKPIYPTGIITQTVNLSIEVEISSFFDCFPLGLTFTGQISIKLSINDLTLFLVVRPSWQNNRH